MNSNTIAVETYLQNIRSFNSDFFSKEGIPPDQSFEKYFSKAMEMSLGKNLAFCPNFNTQFFVDGYQRRFGKNSIKIQPELLKDLPYVARNRPTSTRNTNTEKGYIFSFDQSINLSSPSENAYTLFDKGTHLNLKEYLLLQAFTGEIFDKDTVTYLQDKDRHGFMLIAYYIADRELLNITTECPHVENLLTRGFTMYLPLSNSVTRPIKIFR